MASDASILSDYIESFGGDQEAIDKAVENMLDDLFGGSPTSLKRWHQVYNDHLQGIGHSTLSGEFSSKSGARHAKQGSSHDIILSSLNAPSAFAILNNQIRRIQKLQERVEKAEKDLKKMRDHAKTLHEAGVLSKEEYTRYMQKMDKLEQETNEIKAELQATTQSVQSSRSAFEKTLENFDGIKMHDGQSLGSFLRDMVSDAKDIITDELEFEHLGLEKASYIIFKNEESGEYYVKHPETDAPITIEPSEYVLNREGYAKFGNDLSEAEISSFNERVQKLGDFMRDYNFAEQYNMDEGFSLTEDFETLKRAYRDMVSNEAALLQLETRMENLIQQQAALKQELQNLTPEELDIEIAALYAEEETIKQELQLVEESYGDATANIEQIFAKLQELEKNVAEESANLQRIAQEAKEIQDASIGSRHEQLKELHGGGFETWVKENTIFNGEKSAALFAWATDLVGYESKTVAAWNNAIEHPEGSGDYVYRNNETGELYTYSKETGRVPITDPETIIKIYSQAYKEGRLFRNETPFGEDPDNTFNDTIESTELAAENMAKHVEEQAVKPQEEKLEKTEEERNRIQRHLDEQCDATGLDISKIAECNPNAARAASPSENAPSENQALFSHAKAATTPLEPPSEPDPVKHTGQSPSGNPDIPKTSIFHGA